MLSIDHVLTVEMTSRHTADHLVLTCAAVWPGDPGTADTAAAAALSCCALKFAWVLIPGWSLAQLIRASVSASVQFLFAEGGLDEVAI